MTRLLLDTDVVSELMRPQPDQGVVAWFSAQPEATFFVSAITRAEIGLGIALLPPGKRKDKLAAAAREMFDDDFGDLCLAFEDKAADCYGGLVASRIRSGRPISVEDAQIAAIALANGATVVTRNVKDFADVAGLAVVNPWDNGS